MSTMVSQATDPHRSVVVEACAGSGKTWMLVTRVFRLLMAGAPSDSILAITFTRKAAQEMMQRLDELLEQCVLLPDEDLRQLLVQRCCELPEGGAGQVRDMALSVIRARRAVEINTFHGWFTSLCQMAPATMGFSRTAEPSEMQAYWLDAAWTDWMRLLESPDAQPAVQPPVRDAFGQLVQLAGVAGARDMLFALAGQRAAWRLMRQALGDDGLQDSLADDFRFETLRDAQAAFFDDGGIRAHLSVVLKHFEADGKTNRDAAADLVQAFESRSVDLLTSALRTQKGLPRAFKLGKGQLGKLSPTEIERFGEALQALQDSLDGLQHQLTDLHWYHLTACALNLLPHFLERLDVVKAQADVIDFDDLEMTAADIMADEQASAWVRMRLDRRTRHLLLDEFQDTNPLQWLILRNWLTASGSDDGNTVFMVGDPKQSIYRFRRAEARLFAHVRDWMVDHLNAIVLRTDQSRRCSTSVLAAVNAAFTGENPPRKGRTPVQAHTGLHDSPGDGLYVFPLIGQEGGQADASDATQVTEDARMAETNGNVEPAHESPAAEPLSEAQSVALMLQHWKQTGQIARWDEVMVLVRRHKDAVPLGQALQALAVPHSITDRSGRFASLIWEDSLALLRVLLSELNEASVLHLLRSPFFRLQPADLEAWLQQLPCSGEQTGARLWLAASQAGGEVAAAFGTLDRWRQWSATLPLHDVLERIFRETDIEAATVAAAPAQESELARRHWAWMLDWALDLNKGRCPHPVLALQEAARLSEHGGAAAGQNSDLDALRILTIHSAKGLEADIVWLLDANRLGGGDRAGDVHTLLNWPVGEDVPRHLSLHGGDKARGRARAEHFAREDEALADEADHLLYVAMTRARRRICVSGTAARLTKADREAGIVSPVLDGSWYGILSGLPVIQAGAWASAVPTSNSMTVGKDTEAIADRADRARWEALPPLAAVASPVGEVRAPDDTPATLRGQAWHACLQHVSPAFFTRFDLWWEQVSALPDCGLALCAMDEDAFEQVRSRLQSMAGNAALRPFLDPDAVQTGFNEFEWMDAQGRLHRADRIVCMDGVWTVIDYKWAWTEADLPAYQAQLQRYAAALRDTLASEATRIDGILISAQGEIIHLSDLRTGWSAKG